MLEDFIESNGLQAKIMPYSAKGSLIKCRLFSFDKGNALVVSFSKDKVSEEKLKKALKSDSVQQVDNSQAEEITGYKAEFMPPISIYGVKVLLDNKVAESEKVRCLVGEEKTLEISPKEIIEANDEAEKADLTL